MIPSSIHTKYQPLQPDEEEEEEEAEAEEKF